MKRVLRWVFGIALVLAGVAIGVLLFFRWQADSRESRVAAEAAPKPGRYVRAADIELFVQEEGQAGAPAVVFIHGTGAWSETWRPAMKAVAAEGFRAIAIDLPPFGYSSRPATQRYDRPDQAQRIIAALDTLKLDTAILVGHSFGAGATVEAALMSPKRLRALILVDAALGLQATAAEADPGVLVRALLGAKPLRDSLVAGFLTNPGFTKRLVQSFVADPAKVSDERAAVYQQPLYVKGTTSAVGAWLPTLLLPVTGAQSNVVSSYESLTMPVYLIWGALDSITPLAQAEHIKQIVPKAELSIMKNVGHIPQIEDATQFNALLVGLLKPHLN